MKLSFQIANRFLKSNLTQTIIIILGIGIGVSVQIFIGSLITGLQKSLIETTIGNSSQITISTEADSGLISDYKSLTDNVANSDDRIEFVSPALDNAAFLSYDGKSQSLLVRGFEQSRADNIYNLSEYITEGSFPSTKNEVLLGKTLQEKYGLSVGDTFELITPDKSTNSCVISGFFDLKVAAVNNSWCITSLPNAQSIFLTGDKISSIEMQLFDNQVFSADEVATNITAVLKNDSLNITNWKIQNESLLSGLNGQSVSSLMIQVFVMISVVLGIASILAITVMQKSRQIGILKAMGINDGKASLIFLFEGIILGVFGAIVGIALGLGLALAFSTFALNADGTPVVALYIDRNFIALSGCVAVLACMVASLIPARRSSKLNPIDIIRNN